MIRVRPSHPAILSISLSPSAPRHGWRLDRFHDAWRASSKAAHSLPGLHSHHVSWVPRCYHHCVQNPRGLLSSPRRGFHSLSALAGSILPLRSCTRAKQQFLEFSFLSAAEVVQGHMNCHAPAAPACMKRRVLRNADTGAVLKGCALPERHTHAGTSGRSSANEARRAATRACRFGTPSTDRRVRAPEQTKEHHARREEPDPPPPSLVITSSPSSSSSSIALRHSPFGVVRHRSRPCPSSSIACAWSN